MIKNIIKLNNLIEMEHFEFMILKVFLYIIW